MRVTGSCGVEVGNPHLWRLWTGSMQSVRSDRHWAGREVCVVSKSNSPPCTSTANTIISPQVDFSRNAIRRLNVDVLEGLEPHLLELHLDHNLLGNNYNPSFSFTEVAKLTALQVRTKELHKASQFVCLRKKVCTLSTVVPNKESLYYLLKFLALK